MTFVPLTWNGPTALRQTPAAPPTWAIAPGCVPRATPDGSTAATSAAARTEAAEVAVLDDLAREVDLVTNTDLARERNVIVVWPSLIRDHADRNV